MLVLLSSKKVTNLGEISRRQIVICKCSMKGFLELIMTVHSSVQPVKNYEYFINRFVIFDYVMPWEII